MRQRPDRQFGPVRYAELPEDPIQILLNGAFRKVQLVGNLFIQLGLGNQLNHLLLPKAEFGIERFIRRLGASTTGTDPVSGIASELSTASKAASHSVDLPEFNGVHS